MIWLIYFVQLVNSELKDNWLHFHCKQGIGRTTTFMIMYDIMKNAKEVSLDDIVKRQVALSKMSENSAKGFYNDERKSLLTNFINMLKRIMTTLIQNGLNGKRILLLILLSLMNYMILKN